MNIIETKHLKIVNGNIRLIYDETSNLTWYTRGQVFLGESSELDLKVGFKVGAVVEVQNAKNEAIIKFKCVAVKKDYENEVLSYEFSSIEGGTKKCSMTIFND